MKKNKNKKVSSKKNGKAKAPAKKTSLFSGAGKSLRKLGGGISGLSTTQKLAGGALVALGLSYLAKRRGGKAGSNGSSSATTPGLAADASAAEQNLATIDGGNI